MEYKKFTKGIYEYYVLDTSEIIDGLFVICKTAQCYLFSKYISLEIYLGKKDILKLPEDKSFEAKNIKNGSEEIMEDDFVEHKGAQEQLKKIKGYSSEIRDDVSKWTSKDFSLYIHKKFKDTYGINSFEFAQAGGKKYSPSATGAVWRIIKHKLIDVFENTGLGMKELVQYIDWAYDVKSPDVKFPINLGFLATPSLMNEWITIGTKRKSKPKNRRKKR